MFGVLIPWGQWLSGGGVIELHVQAVNLSGFRLDAVWDFQGGTGDADAHGCQLFRHCIPDKLSTVHRSSFVHDPKQSLGKANGHNGLIWVTGSWHGTLYDTRKKMQVGLARCNTE
jgi:hypothetical protein